MTPLIIVSAPSGAGKSTLCDQALKDISRLKDSISCTTRSPRKGESNGNPYFFISEEDFKKKIEQNYFIEWAQVHGDYYGTPKEQLDQAWKEGKFLIMDLDVQGAETFKSLYPDCLSLFILPPDVEVLRDRIMHRDKGETPNMEIRLRNAESEIKKAIHFDYQIVNDDFQRAYSEFKKIIENFIQKV